MCRDDETIDRIIAHVLSPGCGNTVPYQYVFTMYA